MPIPKPKVDETEQDFVNRCMGHPNMQEYETEQRSAICYFQIKNDKVQKKLNQCLADLKSHIEKVELIERYQNEIDYVFKAKIVDGFTSPEPGDLPEAGEDLLARVYSKCRADGGDKEKCSRIAWTAVNNAGYKSKVQTFLQKAHTQLSDIVKKQKELTNDGENVPRGTF
jgi:hypothetical protein